MDRKLLLALRKASTQLYELSLGIIDQEINTLEEVVEVVDSVNDYINYMLNKAEVDSDDKDPEDAVAFYLPVKGGM